MRIWTILLTVALSLCELAVAQAQEKKIGRNDLPPAVERSVATQSQGATIRGLSQEMENGRIYYEAEMLVRGHTKDVLIDGDGNVVEVEEQVAWTALTPLVQQGLARKAGSGKIVKIESLTKHEKLVAYEAVVRTDGKNKEVQVGPEGKSLDHEE